MNRTEIVIEALRIRDELAEDFPEYRGRIERCWFLANRRLRTSAGQARYRDFRISLNPHLYALEENRADFRNTVTHEIAHIVAGPGIGHGPKWRSIFLHMGGNGQRCHSLAGTEALRAAPRRTRKVEVECARCGAQVKLGLTRYKRAVSGRAVYRHRTCGGALVLNSRFLLST